MVKTLFEPTTINGMTLKNRLVRSATWEGMCDPDGRPTNKLVKVYTNLAQGGFRSYHIAASAVEEGDMDYISMSRPFIREPDLPKKWMAGDYQCAECISCNSCFRPGFQEGGLYCVVEKKEQEKGKH